MAKDVFHQEVKNALIKDGWIITNDPLTIRISAAVKVQIDLAAENVIAAERNAEKIAVEIKSFISGSDINEFHTVLGWCLQQNTCATSLQGGSALGGNVLLEATAVQK